MDYFHVYDIYVHRVIDMIVIMNFMLGDIEWCVFIVPGGTIFKSKDDETILLWSCVIFRDCSFDNLKWKCAE